jgi:hypothetical protein
MERVNAYSLALILNEGSFSCFKASQLLGFVSHDQLTRQLSQEWMPSPVADWARLPKKGVLVIDDTVIAKPHSEKIDGVKWQYASSQDKVSNTFAAFEATDCLTENQFKIIRFTGHMDKPVSSRECTSKYRLLNTTTDIC